MHTASLRISHTSPHRPYTLNGGTGTDRRISTIVDVSLHTSRGFSSDTTARCPDNKLCKGPALLQANRQQLCSKTHTFASKHHQSAPGKYAYDPESLTLAVKHACKPQPLKAYASQSTHRDTELHKHTLLNMHAGRLCNICRAGNAPA